MKFIGFALNIISTLFHKTTEQPPPVHVMPICVQVFFAFRAVNLVSRHAEDQY